MSRHCSLTYQLTIIGYGRCCRQSQLRSAGFCCWKSIPARPGHARIYTRVWQRSLRTTKTSGAPSTIPQRSSSGRGCKLWEETFPRQQRSCQIRNGNCGDGKASFYEGETLPRSQLDHEPGANRMSGGAIGRQFQIVGRKHPHATQSPSPRNARNQRKGLLTNSRRNGHFLESFGGSSRRSIESHFEIRSRSAKSSSCT